MPPATHQRRATSDKRRRGSPLRIPRAYTATRQGRAPAQANHGPRGSGPVPRRTRLQATTGQPSRLDEVKVKLARRAIRAVGIHLVVRVHPVVAPALGLCLIFNHPSATTFAANLGRPRVHGDPPMQISYKRHVITRPASQSLHTASVPSRLGGQPRVDISSPPGRSQVGGWAGDRKRAGEAAMAVDWSGFSVCNRKNSHSI